MAGQDFSEDFYKGEAQGKSTIYHLSRIMLSRDNVKKCDKFIEEISLGDSFCYIYFAPTLSNPSIVLLLKHIWKVGPDLHY